MQKHAQQNKTKQQNKQGGETKTKKTTTRN